MRLHFYISFPGVQGHFFAFSVCIVFRIRGMLILGSTILVPPGNQGCAQKLHKKVKFKKDIYICFCMPIQVGKLYKSWNMVTMIRLPKFVLNSWYLVGGLCTRVGPIWWQWMKSSKTFFSLTNLKKERFLFKFGNVGFKINDLRSRLGSKWLFN